VSALNWISIGISCLAVLISLSSLQITELTKVRMCLSSAWVAESRNDPDLARAWRAQADKHWRRAWPTRLLPPFRAAAPPTVR
jgi:hypothetical protein